MASNSKHEMKSQIEVKRWRLKSKTWVGSRRRWRPCFMAPVSAGWGIGVPRGPASRPSRTPTTDGLTRLESDPRQALEIPRRRLLHSQARVAVWRPCRWARWGPTSAWPRSGGHTATGAAAAARPRTPPPRSTTPPTRPLNVLYKPFYHSKLAERITCLYQEQLSE